MIISNSLKDIKHLREVEKVKTKELKATIITDNYTPYFGRFTVLNVNTKRKPKPKDYVLVAYNQQGEGDNKAIRYTVGRYFCHNSSFKSYEVVNLTKDKKAPSLIKRDDTGQNKIVGVVVGSLIPKVDNSNPIIKQLSNKALSEPEKMRFIIQLGYNLSSK